LAFSIAVGRLRNLAPFRGLITYLFYRTEDGVTPRVSILALMIGMAGCAPLHEEASHHSMETRLAVADCASEGLRRDPASGRCVSIAAKPRVTTLKPRAPGVDKPVTTASGVPIEPNASIDARLKDETKLMSGLVALLRSRGYPCGTLSSARPFSTSNGFKLACDRARYRYAIENDNGSWHIKTD
jgi:hypothetical protein